MFEVLFLEDAGVGGLATLVMGENTSKCLFRLCISQICMVRFMLIVHVGSWV